MFKANHDPQNGQPPKKPGQSIPNNSDKGAIVPHQRKPANPNSEPDPHQTHYDRFIASLDDQTRLQMLEGIRIYSLDTKDPFFVLMLAQRLIATALLEAPEKIRAAIIEATEIGVTVMERKSEAIQAALHKKIEWQIATGINRRQQQQEMSGLSSLAIPLFSIAAVTLVGFGGASGWAWAQLTRSPIVPGKVSLTEQQVEDLRWLATPEASLAKNLVKWNDGQIQACQKNQVALFEQGPIVVPGYGKVESGACVLWVVPSDARRFDPQSIGK